MPGRNLGTDSYRYGMNTQEKDDEIYGQGNTYSAEFWEYDARLARRWNVDPKSLPSISSYTCFSNNPLFFIDLKGDTSEFYDIKTNKLLGKINDETSLRRIKIEAEFYKNTAAEFNGCEMTSCESNEFTALAISRAQTAETETCSNFISFETGVLNLTYSGKIDPKNPSYAIGYLRINSIFDDESTLCIGKFAANSGPYGNGSPENGNYKVNNARLRDDNPGMIKNNYGFSMDLIPNFETCRDAMRIHPDGNKPGTLGCIGLLGTVSQLKIFFSTISSYLNYHTNIDLSIDLKNNPNNNGCDRKKPLPKISERL
jgi:hypothetical protein